MKTQQPISPNRIMRMVLNRINKNYIIIPRNKMIPATEKFKKEIFLSMVAKFVAEELNTTVEVLKDDCRKAPAPFGRQLYFWLADKHKPADLTDTEIATFINKSRSMAITMPKSIEGTMSVDKLFNEKISKINQKFNTLISIK